jgi:DNA-binding transcriptional regulator YiaG
MPNFSSLFKEEVTRLARRQVRHEVESLKKASGQYRRDIAALKREVSRLARQASRGERARNVAQSAADKGSDTRIRFVAKGLKSQRERLGLSAAEYAKLADVSQQSIYNWESGTTRPRAEQIAVLASLRALGRKSARARLEQLDRKR